MANKTTTLDFGRFAATDRIEVTSNLNRKQGTLTGAEPIQAVLAALRGLAEGWGVPAGGVPVAGLRLNFYQGDRLLGNVGVGRTFLTALYRGSFWSRPIEAPVYDNLLKLAGLERKRLNTDD
jgi:hypothetical protein